jgi:hypothetical protein
MTMSNHVGSQTLWLCVQANPILAHGMDETVLHAAHTMAFYKDAADCQSHLEGFSPTPLLVHCRSHSGYPNILVTSNST